jgi:tetratricopeptide (TPR) repeat protein
VANKYTRKGKTQAPVVTDEFVSFWQRAYDALLPHATKVAIGLAAAALVIVAVWVGGSLLDSAREDATETFGRAVKMYDADLLGESESAKADDDVPRFKTAAERGAAVLAELDKIAHQHRFARVSKQVLLFKAGVQYDLGRYEDAEATNLKYLDEVGGRGEGDALRAVAQEGVGLAREARGQLDPALEAYRAMDAKGAGPLHDRALYDQARVLAKKGDKAGAEKLYKEILGRVATGPLHEEVENRLAALGG